MYEWGYKFDFFYSGFHYHRNFSFSEQFRRAVRVGHQAQHVWDPGFFWFIALPFLGCYLHPSASGWPTSTSHSNQLEGGLGQGKVWPFPLMATARNYNHCLYSPMSQNSVTWPQPSLIDRYSSYFHLFSCHYRQCYSNMLVLRCCVLALLFQ